MKRSEIKTGITYGRFSGSRAWTLAPAVVVDTKTLWTFRECLVKSADGTSRSEHRYIPSDAKQYTRGRGWVEHECGLLILTVTNCMPGNTPESRQAALADLEKVAASLPADPTKSDVQRLWHSLKGSNVYLALENPANIKGEYAALLEAEEKQARKEREAWERKQAEREEFAARAKLVRSALSAKGVGSARVSSDHRKVTIDLEELEVLLGLSEAE